MEVLYKNEVLNFCMYSGYFVKIKLEIRLDLFL